MRILIDKGNVMNEEKKLMLEYLCHAQEILANVYDYAQRMNNGSAESAMGCADTCIYEAIDALENFGGE